MRIMPPSPLSLSVVAVAVASTLLLAGTASATPQRPFATESAAASLRGASSAKNDEGRADDVEGGSVLPSSEEFVELGGASPLSRNDRRLSASHKMFEPLDCPDAPCSVKNSTWSAESYDPNAGTVIVPCGHCVEMDAVLGDALLLPNGLDVQGRLTIPDGLQLRIETPFVRVQGELVMTSSKPVSDVPDVVIVLTGTDEELTSFVPAHNNEFRCSDVGETTVPSPCRVGKKPFVIAGGKVDIKGLPDNCPTWLRLEDVIRKPMTATLEYPRAPIPACGDDRYIASESFDPTSASPAGWSGYWGASHSVTPEGTFLVADRTSSKQGPTYDLPSSTRECLQPETTYLLTARVRFHNGTDYVGRPTTCASTGSNCLTLSSYRGGTSTKKTWSKGSLPANFGEWIRIQARVTFSREELAREDAYYHWLKFANVEEDVDIEIDDVELRLPSESSFPDDGGVVMPEEICSDLVYGNGNAEGEGYSSFPFDRTGGHVSVEEESNGDGSVNKFFRTYSRDGSWGSLTFDVLPGCVDRHAVYKIRARVRASGSTVPVRSKFEIRTYLNETMLEPGSAKYKDTTIAYCPYVTDEAWAWCESEFVITEEMTQDAAYRWRIQMETYDSYRGDFDVDDVSVTFVHGPTEGLVLPDSVEHRWDAGSELLVTSHTLEYDDGQVRRIASVVGPHAPGFVRVYLNDTIVPPTTKVDSMDFAVEVALLSRNFVVEGARDDDLTNPLHGGHFMVFHSPGIVQTIEGVEFRNMGQQKNLGRYPIHFHMCGDVSNSVVSKNAIRESNQRCVVIHGTHNLTIVDNVAYDAKGHCYMTEDGGEVDNLFLRNLGAYVRIPEEIISTDETDDEPSVFWCTNPQNEWIGNVAAGCEKNGFWFEVRSDVRGPTGDLESSVGMKPNKLSLKAFEDNVAHSNGDRGLRTYPNGYIPDEEAVFYNFVSYMNRYDGVFFHNSHNLALERGIFSDNRKAVNFDRAEDVRFEDAQVIGFSDSFRKVLNREKPTVSCTRIGTELHTFSRDADRGGAVIAGIEYKNFTDSPVYCEHDDERPVAIAFDDEIRSGTFDYWTTIRDVTMSEGVDVPVDLCVATESDVTDVYLTDLTSSLRPAGETFVGVSSVVSDSPDMTALTFLDPTKCTAFADRCYRYCVDACLRTVTYAVDASYGEGYKLRIKLASDPGTYVDAGGSYYYEQTEEMDGTLDVHDNTRSHKHRTYAATLPPGQYVAEFLNETGRPVWPTYVEETYEKPQCTPAFPDGAVALSAPEATIEECSNLIRNGDAEMSNATHPHWSHRDGGVQVLVGAGIGNSNALADYDQTETDDAVAQYFDTRCLNLLAGRQYEIRAHVKLVNLDDDGGTYVCTNADRCPEAEILLRRPSEDGRGGMDEQSWDVAKEYLRPDDFTGWRVLHDVFTIDDRISDASSVLFYIERDLADVQMLIDDVSVTLLDRVCDGNLVRNGDFSGGTSEFWTRWDDSQRTTLELHVHGVGGPEDYALVHSDRESKWNTPQQHITNGCMVAGERYLVSSRFQLRDAITKAPFACHMNTTSGVDECPEMELRSWYYEPIDYNKTEYEIDAGYVARTAFPTTAVGWNSMYGVYAATEVDEAADVTRLTWDQVDPSKDMIIDDVSITHLPQDCSDWIMNGDAEYDGGRTAAFWWRYGSATTLDVVDLGNDNHAIKVTRRTKNYHGMEQNVDARCVTSGSKWTISAKFQIFDRNTGSTVTCDPSSTSGTTGCPPVRIRGRKDEVTIFDQKQYSDLDFVWIADELNPYRKNEFVVNDVLADADTVTVYVRNYNLDWDIVVDDFGIAPFVVVS